MYKTGLNPDQLTPEEQNPARKKNSHSIKTNSLKAANLCMSREQTKRSGVGLIPFEVLKDLDIASD